MKPFPQAFSEAYQLSGSGYLTPQLANISSKDAVCVDLGRTGTTKATSTIPVVGTMSLNACTAIILYNRKTKTAAIKHIQAPPDPEDYHELLSKVRDNPQDRIDIHIIGASVTTDEGQNDLLIDSLQDVLQAIKETPGNVRLVTFDVLGKPKPDDVAIDTRTGKLIRGSELFQTSLEAFQDAESTTSSRLFANWNIEGSDFDGTVPALQKQHHRS